jgi:hypothetical protein
LPNTGNQIVSRVSAVPTNYIERLALTWLTANTIQIGLGSCRDWSDVYYITNSAAIVVDITVTGVNGLDTGAAVSDTFYYVYLISDSSSTNPVRGLLSLDYINPLLPAGYDIYRRIGCIRTATGAVTIQFFRQFLNGIDRFVYYMFDDFDLEQILTAGNAVVMTPVYAGNYIPPTSNLGYFYSLYDLIRGAGAVGTAYRGIGGGIAAIPPNKSLAHSTGDETSHFALHTEDRNIRYFLDNATDDLYLAVIGYFEQIAQRLFMILTKNFVNATPRYLTYPNQVTGQFAANVPATRVIDNLLYVQLEDDVDNLFEWTQELENGIWTKTGLNAATPVIVNNYIAPDGKQTADKIVENNANSVHLISQVRTPDGVSSYCYSVFGHASGRDWIVLNLSAAGFPANSYRFFNVNTGALGAAGVGISDSAIEIYENGNFFCWIRAVSTAAVATTCGIYLSNADTVFSYLGDNASGADLWNPQLEIGIFPSSTILNTTPIAQRNDDDLTWATVNVPAWLYDKIQFRWIPYGSQAQGGFRYLIFYNQVGNRWAYYFSPGTQQIRIQGLDGPGVILNSNALTFSRNQELIITIDPQGPSVDVQGATAGNGTVVGAVTWQPTGGPVWYGSRQFGDLHCRGLLSEPYPVPE